MDPLPPMQPMKPMEPLRFERWWPADLGEPSTAGGQNGLRFAVFPDKRRLLVEHLVGCLSSLVRMECFEQCRGGEQLDSTELAVDTTCSAP